MLKIDAQARAVLLSNASKKMVALEASDNNNHYIAPLAHDMRSNQLEVENIYSNH